MADAPTNFLWAVGLKILRRLLTIEQMNGYGVQVLLKNIDAFFCNQNRAFELLLLRVIQTIEAKLFGVVDANKVVN